MARNYDSMIRLSVMVPVFNEEMTLCELTLRIKAVIGGLGKQFEIIFVDDGSTDNSWVVPLTVGLVIRMCYIFSFQNLVDALMHCPACQSQNAVKNGFNPLNKQLYRCKDCGRQFVLNSANIVDPEFETAPYPRCQDRCRLPLGGCVGGWGITDPGLCALRGQPGRSPKGD